MKSIRIFLTLILSCFHSVVSAQTSEPNNSVSIQIDPIEIVWQMAIGSSESNEIAHDIVSLPDGGAVLSYFQNGTGAHLRRVDESGETIWDNAFSGEGYYPRIDKLTVTSDGSIVGAGHVSIKSKTGKNEKKFQPFAIKVNGDGKVIWQKHYKMWFATTFNDVEISNDGGFVFAGVMGMPYVFFGGAIHVIKTYENGERLWYKTIRPKKIGSKIAPYKFGSMILDHNDQILINAHYGGTQSQFSVHDDMVQVHARISQKGKLVSLNEFGGERWEVSNDALIDHNNNMIIGGYKTFEDETKNGIYVSAFTPQNTIKWEVVINDPITGSLGGLKLLPNGNLIGTGSSQVSSSGRQDQARFQDMIVVCLSGEGELLWSKKYENLAKFGIKAMDLSADGHLWALSEIGYNFPGQTDIYLAKLALK